MIVQRVTIRVRDGESRSSDERDGVRWSEKEMRDGGVRSVYDSAAARESSRGGVEYTTGVIGTGTKI